MKQNFLERAQAYLSEKKEETQKWRQNHTEDDDSTAAIVWRRYSKQIMIGIVLVTALTLGLIIFLPKGHDDTNTGIPSFQVAKEDKAVLEQQTKEFVSVSGKWGIDSSKVTDDNVREIAYLVSTRAKGYQNFTISRVAAYEQVKNMVYPKSSVDFSETTLRTWERDSSVVDNYLPSFEVSNIRVNAPSESRYISINGQNVERVGVEVTYDSTETIRVMRGTDVASDGSFGIFEKTFKNNKATIYFVRDSEGNWKVHSMEGDNKFLLVPFGVADYESYIRRSLPDRIRRKRRRKKNLTWVKLPLLRKKHPPLLRALRQHLLRRAHHQHNNRLLLLHGSPLHHRKHHHQLNRMLQYVVPK